MKYVTLVVFVIALGKEIEVIYLLFEARGLETDQPDVLMFKFRQKAAGGWRNENSISSEKEDTFVSSLSDTVCCTSTSIIR